MSIKKNAKTVVAEGRRLTIKRPWYLVSAVVCATVIVLTWVAGLGYLTQFDWLMVLLMWGFSVGTVAAFGLISLHLFEEDQERERRRLLAAAEREARQ